jgi:SagB-type dehydrogenase family enzyme
MPTTTMQLRDDEIGQEPVGWLAQLYHENTKISSACLPEVEAHIVTAGQDEERLRPCPAIEPSLPRIRLPRFRSWSGLDRIIRRRRTMRALVARPIPARKLGRILFNASGVTHWPTSSRATPPWPLCSAPSAGALYSIELRVAAFNVRGLKCGIYRYHPYEHCLEMTASGVAQEQLAQASLHPDLVCASATVLALFADCDRLIAKYGDRGYRFALLEAGHMAQNILLTCADLRLAAVPVGGFLDDECASIFTASPLPSWLTYLIVVGHAPKHAWVRR